MLIDVAISGDRNRTKKGAETILDYKKIYNRNTAHVGCKIERDTNNNNDN